ncbi:MAG: HAD family hydrolase, partial [Candidatus Hodarchaeales archaeon]
MTEFSQESLAEKFSRIDLIIFDFDGTLFKGETFSLPIFHNCLRNLYSKFTIKHKYPSDETILSQFGKQAEDIYKDLFGSTNVEIINYFSKCVEHLEVKSFEEGGGELFPNIEKVLSILKENGFRMAICTNAREDYIEAAINRFHLNRFFDEIFAAGMFPGKDKKWMVQNLVKKLSSSQFMVVGDRYHDIEAAKANNGIAVGCKYGYGRKEIEKADVVISSFIELLSILDIRLKS